MPQELNSIITEKEIPPENIYSTDEKGAQQGGGRKSRGKKYFVPQMQCPCYCARSMNLELVTCINCVSADGTALLPGFIFQGGKQMCTEWYEVGEGIW